MAAKKNMMWIYNMNNLKFVMSVNAEKETKDNIFFSENEGDP